MTKFTNGPWKVEFGANPDDFIVSDVIGRTICEPNVHIALEEVPTMKREETLANAHLISQAPSMYEALEFIKKFFTDLEESCGEDDPLTAYRRRHHAPLHAVMDKALKLARGEGQ